MSNNLTIYISIKISFLDKELAEIAAQDGIGAIVSTENVFLVIPDKNRPELFMNCIKKFKFSTLNKFSESKEVNSMLLPIDVDYVDEKAIKWIFSFIEFAEEPRDKTHYIVTNIQRSFDSLNTGIHKFEV
jgi:hypothetical protein